MTNTPERATVFPWKQEQKCSATSDPWQMKSVHFQIYRFNIYKLITGSHRAVVSIDIDLLCLHDSFHSWCVGQILKNLSFLKTSMEEMPRLKK